MSLRVVIMYPDGQGLFLEQVTAEDRLCDLQRR